MFMVTMNAFALVFEMKNREKTKKREPKDLTFDTYVSLLVSTYLHVTYQHTKLNNPFVKMMYMEWRRNYTIVYWCHGFGSPAIHPPRTC